MRVAALAATIAAGIPAEEIQALGGPGSARSAAYLGLRSSLIAARQANPDLKRIFVLLPGSTPRQWRFALDAVTARKPRCVSPSSRVAVRFESSSTSNTRPVMSPPSLCNHHTLQEILPHSSQITPESGAFVALRRDDR